MVVDGNFEQLQLEGDLYHQLNALIVGHLRDNNFYQAATAVAMATKTPLDVETSPNRLLNLVSMGLAVEKGEPLRGVSSSKMRHSSGKFPGAQPAAIDFSASQDARASSKSFVEHETRNISEHKNIVRCARFSPDGRYVATGSADMSVKLFEVVKIKQMMLPDSGDAPIRPVIRTFYDHTHAVICESNGYVWQLRKFEEHWDDHIHTGATDPQCPRVKNVPINDLDFHPQNTILVSAAKDQTIKFFDFSKPTAKRAFRVIQDTHNVRSISVHPSGDYLLAGTDHPIPHLYDINSFKCYLSANVPECGANAEINQVRYSASGGLYVTASKDGAIRLWDGSNASCIRFIEGAHGTAEVTSAAFTKDEKFVLSSGKDSTLKLWEVGSGKMVKQYSGATHKQLRGQAAFNDTEEFILAMDEHRSEIVIWDSLTAAVVARLRSNHTGSPRWIVHSPTEAAFVTCGTDRSVRFWKELP